MDVRSFSAAQDFLLSVKTFWTVDVFTKVKAEYQANIGNLDNSTSVTPEIEDLLIDIFEYSKPRGYYGNFEIDEEVENLIKLMAPLKDNRILAMIPIFGLGQFDIVHTWQDWCNIYGGLASLISLFKLYPGLRTTNNIILISFFHD